MSKRPLNILTALQIGRLKEPGLYADGGGLYLKISANGGRSWVFRYKTNAKEHRMGLGAAGDVTLADAREKARDARRLRLDGTDPILEKRSRLAAAKAAALSGVTFEKAAARYITAHEAGWKNRVHREQWRSSLKAYAYPLLGSLDVRHVTTDHVLRVIEPIWSNKSETASRLRGRIESILDWSTARGLRTGENPARWRGHLDHLLPRPSKIHTVRHHAALSFDKIGDFLVLARAQEGFAAQALKILILTATRSSEVIGARWDEIDLGKKVWTIPASRTKTNKEHRVPLSDPAVKTLQKALAGRTNAFVFPSYKDRHLSNGALLALLKRMERKDITPHGFRSTFRDWVAEASTFPGELAEMALGHVVSGKVEAAYRRGDLFEKRRKLMDAWAAYSSRPSKSGNVVPLSKVSQ